MSVARKAVKTVLRKNVPSSDAPDISQWLHDLEWPVDDEGAGQLASSSNVTELKSEHERVRLYDVALGAVSQGVVITGADRRIVSVNSAFEAITGFAEHEVVGRNCDFLQGPLTQRRSIKRMRHCLNDGIEFFGEVQNYRKDGRTFWNELTITPACDAEGQITHFIGVCRDVTERVLNRKSLVEREKLARQKSDELDMVLGSMNQGISAFDREMRLTVWNRQYAVIFDLDPNLLQAGMSFLELMELQKAAGNLAAPPTQISAALLKRASSGLEFSDTSRTGSGKTILTTRSPRSDGGWIATHQDVTIQYEQSQALAETSRQLTTALTSMRHGLTLFDVEGRLLLWNKRYLDLYSLQESAIRVGMPFVDLLMARADSGTFDGDVQQVIKKYKQAFGRTEQCRIDTTLADGRIITTVAAGTSDGGWITSHEDVTAQRQQQAQLALQNIRFAAALNNMSHGLSMFDKDQRLVTCNPAYAQIYRLPPELTLPGTQLSEIFAYREINGSVPVEGHQAFDAERRGSLVQHSRHDGIIEMRDGRFVRFAHRVMQDGGWVATHEDITEYRRVEAQIEHDALHDSLTGLPNRRFLDRVLAERETDCRASGEGLAILHLDLDHFKQINDTLGHEAGDAMLIHAASVLEANLRDNDFACRGGGDEFVVVCAMRKGTKDLARFAARIIKQMSQPAIYHNLESRCGVSVGIAYQSGAKVDAKKLLINADIALFEAKSNGRGCHRFFTASMQLAVTKTKRLADEIQSGIENGEFVAYYQPQFNALTREISGVEALVRWQHPVLGLLTPDKFLNVAAEMGAVGTIDGIILEQTLDNFKRWNEQGLGVPRASVNVSARRLRDPALIKTLKRLAITPGTISFELLESIYLDEADGIVASNIEKIRGLGIDLEVDDFGTGHTSILSLLKLKPKRLKIDRRLVAPVVASPTQRQLLRTVVEIGHSLGIKVIAEGVETEQHAVVASELGCDELQGYAFSRPIGAEAFAIFAEGLLQDNAAEMVS